MARSRRLAAAGLLALLLTLGLSLGVVGGTAQAAEWKGCNQWSYCWVELNRWETRTYAMAGAGAATVAGVPWWAAFALERAADYAVERGYCLSVGFNPFYRHAVPSYHRC